MNDFARRPMISLIATAMLTCSLVPAPRSTVETAGPGNMPAAMIDALKGLGPAGWSAVSSEIPAPVASPAASSPAEASPKDPAPISADRLKKLISTTQGFTDQSVLSQRLTRTLGLTSGDGQLIVKECLHKTEAASHLFAVPVDSSIDRLVLIVMEPNTIRWVVTDRSGRLIAGAWVQRGQQPVLLSDEEARALYAGEGSIWSETADRIKS
jgi:hypothetical protein